MSRWAGALVGWVVAAALLTGCAAKQASPPTESPAYGALALRSVGPTRFDAASLRGKVLLVEFFATWCFYCVADVPSLIKAQELYGPKGFTVVAVGMDLEGEKVLRPFAESYQLPYPVLVADPVIRSGQSAFGPIKALPTTFLLDREGRALVAYEGVALPKDLFDLVGRAVER